MVDFENLELAFEKEWMRNICEKAEIAEEQLGAVAAKYLQHRVADLLSADNPTELLAGNPRVLGDGTFAIDYSMGAEIRFVPNHRNYRAREPNGIDWSTVYRIRITSISTYGRTI